MFDLLTNMLVTTTDFGQLGFWSQQQVFQPDPRTDLCRAVQAGDGACAIATCLFG